MSDPAASAHEAVAPAPWRLLEPETFAATVLAAADQLGVQPLAVEKDYWVCEALRAIQARFPEAIIFKGGTSLEKLRLVQRFSEDLDLLVVGQFGGATATKTAMRNMCEIAAEAVGGGLSDPRSGGNPGGFHRRAYLHPPLENHAAPESTVADPAAVLLELGQSGGAHPASTHEITSLLSRQLAEVGFDIERYQDLRPVTVQVLHPGRTLLEKLLRVNNFTKTFDDGPHGWPRIGRQFYDIWALLGDARVLDFLADTAQARAVLRDCLEVSNAFTPDEPPPAAGFAASLAFDPEGPLSARLRAEHDAAMRDLYYGAAPGPTFDEVLERVRDHAGLLKVD